MVDVDVDVDVDELNNVLRTNRHTKINKDDDSDQINIEDYDEDDIIEEEEDNSN